ncbi:MAG TPA: hypothetical protein VGT99_12635 [Gammaproteobacteria bacterium]|nr:hypothetical protein [Gammaproteobacteria bacterium]
MFSPTLILVARAIHILAGVYWAGAMFVFAGSLLPAMRKGAPALVPVMKQIGMRTGIAGLLTVLAGIYLFAALHSQDESLGGKLLGIGAVAAVLAFLIALLVNMPAGRKLAKLHASPPAKDQERVAAALQARVVLGARLIAGLLGIAVLCMAVFRYASLL